MAPGRRFPSAASRARRTDGVLTWGSLRSPQAKFLRAFGAEESKSQCQAVAVCVVNFQREPWQGNALSLTLDRRVPKRRGEGWHPGGVAGGFPPFRFTTFQPGETSLARPQFGVRWRGIRSICLHGAGAEERREPGHPEDRLGCVSPSVPPRFTCDETRLETASPTRRDVSRKAQPFQVGSTNQHCFAFHRCFTPANSKPLKIRGRGLESLRISP